MLFSGFWWFRIVLRSGGWLSWCFVGLGCDDFGYFSLGYWRCCLVRGLGLVVICLLLMGGVVGCFGCGGYCFWICVGFALGVSEVGIIAVDLLYV